MYKRYLKRIFDLIVSTILIILFMPLMFVISIALVIENRGPIIFRQDRFGQNAKHFHIYKFRTMYWKDMDGKKIGYVTKLGEFLRTKSLDELPQLFNILKGDMSFVGPRPWIVEYLDYFTPRQILRCKVKPGISGWAQVNGRNNLGILEKINYDIWYVNNLSLSVDAMIFIKTILVVLRGQHSSLDHKMIEDERKELKRNYYLYNYRLNKRGV